MKLAARAIPEFLRQPDRQSVAVLIYGRDEGMVRERAQAVAESLLGRDADAMQRTELSDDILKTDPARLSDELAAYGLLGGKRIVLLRAESEKWAPVIEHALADVPKPNYLIVQTGELTPRSSLRQLFESGANLAALPCYADEAADITSLLRAALAEQQIRIDPEAVDYVTAQLGNDRQVTRREIEKLVLYAGAAGHLTLQDAQALSEGNRELNLEAVAIAAADGNLPQLDRLLNEAWREQTAPVAVLRSVQRYFHRLYLARGKMGGGQSAEQAVSALKPPVFFRQIPVVIRHVQRWNNADIAHALQRAAEGEAACKGGSAASPTLACATALLGIAGRGRALAR